VEDGDGVLWRRECWGGWLRKVAASCRWRDPTTRWSGHPRVGTRGNSHEFRYEGRAGERSRVPLLGAVVVAEGVAVASRCIGLRAGEGVDCLEELGAIEWFQGEPGEARGEAARANFDERMRGESDDGQGTAQGAELASGRFSVEDRHLQVHEDNVEPGASAGAIDLGFGREHGVDREAAVLDDDQLCPGFVQVVLEQALIVETVFDDKDAKPREVGE
jgi:hypothetical protein